jgi:superfamily II DNA/RNA helicase
MRRTTHGSLSKANFPMHFQNSEIQIDRFTDMGLAPGLIEALEKMHISKPTPVQMAAIPVAMAGTDLVAIAQTGSGKTLAYVLSVITHLTKTPETRALILSTSRETAEQVYRVFEALALVPALPVSLVTTGTPNAIQVSQLKKIPRIIVATPGRICDHLRNNKLLLKGLSILVIDEADRMLDLGFEPQLKLVSNTLRGSWQTMMFAASFGPKAEPVAKILMKTDAVLVRANAAEKPVETLMQRVLFLTESQKNNRLLDELKKMKGGVIIFTESKESCVKVGRLLAHHEFSADFAHGDMNPGHRNRVFRELREGKIQTMVTTDLLARGIDVPHIAHVVNFDLPYKAEDFLHRIGRTARAGREGTAITFVTPADGRTYRKIKSYLQGASEETLASNFKFVESP